MQKGTKTRKRGGAASLLRRAPDRGIHLLLIFTPLAFGGAESWGKAVIQVLVGGVLATWAIGRMTGVILPVRAPRLRGILAAVLLLVGLVLAQTVPLPPGWIGVLSPATGRLYEASVPGYEEGHGLPPSGVTDWLLRSGPATDDLEDDASAVPRPLDAPVAIARPVSIDAVATRRSLVLLVGMMGLFFYVACCADRRRIGRFVRTAAGVAVVVTLFGLVQMMTWNGRIYWVREGAYHEVFGPFVNRNAYAAFVIPFLPVLTALAIAARRRRGGVSGASEWAGAAVLVAGILASLSRGGVLAAAFSLTVLFVCLYIFDRRPGELAAAILLPLAGAALFLWRGAEVVAARLGTIVEGIEVPSIAQRLDVWWRTIAMIRDHPILGTGLGTFRVGFLRYAPSDTRWWMTAHNDYLEILSEVGACGALVALAGVVAWARRAVRIRKLRGDAGRYLYAGILAGLAGVFLHAVTNADLAVPAVCLVVALLAGGLLGLARDAVEGTARAVRGTWSGPALRWGCATVAGFLLINTWDGVIRFRNSTDRILAATASRRGDLGDAYHRVGEALSRRRSPEALLALARLDRRAIAFGLPLAPAVDRGVSRLGEGIGAAVRVIDLSPGLAPAWMEVALLYQAQGDAAARRAAMLAAGAGDARGNPAPRDTTDRAAIAAAEIAARLQPEDAAPHDFLARLLRDRGEMDRAALHLRRSFALMPSLADHDWLLSEPPDALLSAAILEGIDRAVPAAGRSPVAIFRARAEALEMIDRPGEAAAAWEGVAVMAHGRDRGEAWLRIGRIRLEQGRPEESLAPLSRAASGGSPWEADARYFLGKAHALLGSRGEAVEAFRAFLALRPDRPLAHRALGQALLDAGDYTGAERVLERAGDLFPDDEGVRLLLAEARRARGESVESP